ncbi:MAG TPA: sensor histidine kinase [Galbitalea sp.]|jgi:signal transduction histidine kinase|nr:sensor histidine kinase [Galbitalea sp.]
MTIETALDTTPFGTAPRPANFYLRLWRSVPRELGFLVLGFPIATAGFAVSIAMFNAGLGTIFPIFIGIFIFIGALYVSRGFGTLELVRLDWAGQPAIKRPNWQDARARTGFWGWVRSLLANGHYWLALLHTMIINFAVSLVTWTMTIVWISTGLGGITYWFWERFLPPQGHVLYISQWLLFQRGPVAPNVGYDVIEALFYLVVGILILVTLPFVTRGLTAIHWGIAYGVLGAWKSESLTQTVHDLSEARGAASSAEGHSLRRLERDIHDGPQQRLVRMQMDLAAAERQLDADPEKARGLIAEAMQQSKDALDELRALSRGFAPPILLDRGLVAALESAATRSSIPANVIDELPAATRLDQEVERNAYFVASEALTNAIKHSGATAVDIRVAATASDLVISVSDNGTGGATTKSGHGLAGLRERMRGVSGSLEVHSPTGGPTVVTARLPLAAAS